MLILLPKNLTALTSITNYIELPKRRILTKAQFNYCPIILKFHSRSLNSKINRFHERYLTISYRDKYSNFEELLNKDNSLYIHFNNIHALVIELYKIAHDMSPKIISDVLKLRDSL